MAGQILIAGGTFAISDGSTTVNASAVETLTMGGTPTSGTTTGSYAGGLQGTDAVTIIIPYNVTAAALQTQLNGMGNIGVNAAGLPNAVTGGGPWPATPITVTFQNDLANQPVQLWTFPATGAAGNSLVGGSSPAVTAAMTTPGTKAGGVFAAVSRLTDIVFPNTKKDVKEVTNFDSLGLTKEYIGGYIAPGDIALNAQWIGDVTQDWRNGVIAKFYSGKTYAVRTNVPNKVPQPGAFTPGISIYMNGFLTDGSPSGAKHDDVMGIKGSFQISGLPIFGEPVQ